MQILNISVVIPCYNARPTLLRSLDSVVAQVAVPSEIVIVDDGSDELIKPLIDKWSVGIDIPIRVVRQPNRGASAARNVGIDAAKGHYIAFLDADDIWLPDKLRIQHEIMVRENLTLLGHGYDFQAKKSYPSKADMDTRELHINKLRKWRFSCGNPFFTPTVMVCRKTFSGFDERFRRVDDYKAWIENFEPGRCGYIDMVLAAGFKPPIGHSGLTASIDRMHESYLEVLKALLKERRIGLVFYGMARLIEALKLPIRRHRMRKATIS